MAETAASSASPVSGLAQRYASALFDLAVEQDSVEATGAALDRVMDMVRASPELERVLGNPIFTAEQQTAAMAALLARAGVTGIASNFVRLVASKRRLFALPAMIRAYGQLADARAGIMRAEVTVASPLSAKNRATLQEALDAQTGRKVAIAETVDPVIIGGLVVKLGSRMIDSSLRTRLNALKLAMKEVG